MAVLFVAPQPLSRSEVCHALSVDETRLRVVLGLLRQRGLPGLQVRQSGAHLQLVTAPGANGAVERLIGSPPPARLSRAALEALAVIAYKQPATRGDVDAVRGVNSDSAVGTLLARGLVTEIGRRETLGRPALLATTPDFLSYLGLAALEELPPLPPPERVVRATLSLDAQSSSVSEQ